MRFRSIPSFAALVTLACALALPRVAAAQVPLINTFGGPLGYGTTCLGPNDDGSSDAIDITSAFPMGLHFFSGTYTSIYVNTNGNITFSGPVSQFTAQAFPVSNQPMIAPYWADVDIRSEDPSCSCGAGTDPTCPGSAPCGNPTTNGVWWHLDPGQIIVTWDHVGYYSCQTDKVMNFQLILTSAASCGNTGDFDVEFRFNVCQWEAGEASGGTDGLCMGSGGPFGTPCVPAQSGFDAGDSTHYVAIPGSLMNGISTVLCTMSNVDMPGIWRFQIRNGTVMCPDAGMPCSTGMQGICAQGHMQCVGSGTQCVPDQGAQPSMCNGLDNDCNGTIDDGPCPAGTVCDGTQCVPMCVEGGCFSGQVCNAAGLCEDQACVGVMCQPGERCMAGMCVGGCAGVTCPQGEVCRNGGCVDPCSGITCDMTSVCEGGMCVPKCPCRICGTGQSCSPDGHCVDASCSGVSCAPGMVCMGGNCMDGCTGVTCPMGQTCANGQCVPGTSTGGDGGTASDGSTGSDGASGSDASASDGGGGDGGNVQMDGAPGDAAGFGHRSSGCTCRTQAGSPSRSLAGLALAVVAFASVRRRRASRRA